MKLDVKELINKLVNNNPLEWKYAPLDVIGTTPIDISGLNFSEICVHVDVNQGGNRFEFVLPKNVIQTNGWYRQGGYHNGSNDYALIIINVTNTRVLLVGAYLNGGTYTSNTRVQVYYR